MQLLLPTFCGSPTVCGTHPDRSLLLAKYDLILLRTVYGLLLLLLLAAALQLAAMKANIDSHIKE